MCLGVLNKDKNVSSDMIDILSYFHQFVPGNDTEIVRPALSFVDELTFEREHNAQEDQRDSSSPSKRFERLITYIADFRAF